MVLGYGDGWMVEAGTGSGGAWRWRAVATSVRGVRRSDADADASDDDDGCGRSTDSRLNLIDGQTVHLPQRRTG